MTCRCGCIEALKKLAEKQLLESERDARRRDTKVSAELKHRRAMGLAYAAGQLRRHHARPPPATR
jgi:hypothetical protein